MSEDRKPPYDQALANRAAAVDHCLKLGGVVIDTSPKKLGFAKPEPPRPPEQER